MPAKRAVIGAVGALAVVLALSRGPVELLQAPLQHERLNPEAVAQQLAQISAQQQAVLRAQEKLPGFETGSATAQQQELLTKDVPYRLSGYTPPGGVPAAPVKPW
jgi:hypothetical protein